MPNFQRLPLASLLSAAAGVIHIAAAVPHFADDHLLGMSFVAAGGLQLAMAAALLLRPRRRAIAAALLVHLVALGAWATSRTVGLPIGHPGPEAIGVADAITVVFELAAVGLLSARWTRTGVRVDRSFLGLGALALVAVVVGGGAGAAIADLAGGHGHRATVSSAAPEHDHADGHDH